MVSKFVLLILVSCILILTTGGAIWAVEIEFEYPYYLLEAYNPDGDCYKGMDVDGRWPVPVIPKDWLVGPPPSDMSGVTLPTDRWIELRFRGRVVDGQGDDIYLIEHGQCGEQALIFLVNSAGQDYPIGIATALDSSLQAPSEISFDISGVPSDIEPCAIRIVALDLKGGSPGFDIGNVRARTYIGCSDIASEPFPVDGAEDVGADTVLRWLAGCSADRHFVYIGNSADDVGGEAIPVIEPPQPQDVNIYDPCGLYLGESYYWRIDEVNTVDGNSLSVGDIWRFIVTNCLIVDDFEFYNNSDNRLHDVWKWKGQAIMYIDTHPVHRCFKSLTFSYYCDELFYSEIVRQFNPAQDWAKVNAKSLELFFYGRQENRYDGGLYLVLSDGDANVVVSYDGDVNDVLEPSWHPWRIDLTSLTDIDLSRIESLAIGFRNVSSEPRSFGSGTVYFDSIAIYGSRCLEENRPISDVDGDCVVDFVDIEEMAYAWLQTRNNVYSVKAPNEPVAWYRFDGNVNDSIIGVDGQLRGNVTFIPGVYGQGIEFDGQQACVHIPDAGRVFNEIDGAISIAFWQCGADSAHRADTVCCSNYVYGSGGPVVAINLGCWREPGKYNWDCGQPWSLENRLSGEHRYKGEWSGCWNHWVFTKDNNKGRMEIFLNGALYDSKDGAYSPISGVTSFDIGSGWYGGYDGAIDDFRIYSYALSAEEAAYIATGGSGVLDRPIMSPADLNGDEQIDFGDFAVLSDMWLEQRLWP
jgi:hypothetical protein